MFNNNKRLTKQICSTYNNKKYSKKYYNGFNSSKLGGIMGIIGLTWMKIFVGFFWMFSTVLLTHIYTIMERHNGDHVQIDLDFLVEISILGYP